MLSDPLQSVNMSIANEGTQFYGTRAAGDGKSVRLAIDGPLADAGLKDQLTISHSEDPKSQRRRSLFRADIEYPNTVTGKRGTASAYVVLDYIPGDGDEIPHNIGSAPVDLKPAEALLYRLELLFRGSQTATTLGTISNNVATAFLHGLP